MTPVQIVRMYRRELVIALVLKFVALFALAYALPKRMTHEEAAQAVVQRLAQHPGDKSSAPSTDRSSPSE